ncbi:MAG: hypothetical protein DRH10_00710 [Deltaproteobacteria bacterium]|nr:MAG: hypothetical protein DRH10_00710 [Deltaproteobacteria bacterium]RLC88364.1 MAG: hypothetical protein DRJ03_02925 [Chloroflexota bacterium]
MNLRRKSRARRSSQAGFIDTTLNRAYGGLTEYDLSTLTFGLVSPYYDSILKGWVFDDCVDEIDITGHPFADGAVAANMRFLIVSRITGLPLSYKIEAHDDYNNEQMMSPSWSGGGVMGGMVGMVHALPTNEADIGDIYIFPMFKHFEPCVLLLIEKDEVGLGNVYPSESPGDGYDFSPNCDGMVDIDSDLSSTPAFGWAAMDFDGMGWESKSLGSSFDVMSSGGAGPYTASMWCDVPGYIGQEGSADYSFDSSC